MKEAVKWIAAVGILGIVFLTMIFLGKLMMNFGGYVLIGIILLIAVYCAWLMLACIKTLIDMAIDAWMDR